MQLLRSIAGQLFIVFFIHSFHNVKIQALPQSVLTASASTIGEEESVTLQCSARAGDPPKKCWFYLISPNGEKNLAFECQATFTGSVLLAENFALAEVKVRCYYTNDRGEPAPHSDIVSITVARALPQSLLTASASSIREEESVTLQCSAKAGHPPRKCLIFLIRPTQGQKNIAFECQETFTGSDLLRENWSLAEVKVGCFYTNDRWKPPTAPHSDILSITVRRALPQSVLTASASSIREEESVTLQCSAKEGDTPKKCYIYWFIQANEQNKIALDCQATYTGSDLLTRTGALAEVKLRCFYTNDRDEPAPHSDIVSITVRRVVTGSPTSVSQISPTPARPTSNRPTPARPTPASPTPASPTPARPTPARPTSASPQLASPITACTTTAATTVENPNSVVPGSPTSTSTTTAATTMVNSNSSAPYTPPGRIFLKAAIILIVCCGVIVFLIVLLFAVLQTWRRRKKNTMEMKSLNTGSSKVVNRSGSGIKKDGDYHMYSTISNEPSAPNQTLVYDLLQAN
ncbi:uncharacterized protein LOC115557665 isoform X2 [Gadus morhua]|uniref:uncharacterized protein LOC115557665 isoform X2 n=1 Tax=Gadus morhua TaxID=8049 RepID=UPI0011B56D57|nr:uncharacterized protein LOC115557665 isoform X2 [Gadus morhua]